MSLRTFVNWFSVDSRGPSGSIHPLWPSYQRIHLIFLENNKTVQQRLLLQAKLCFSPHLCLSQWARLRNLPGLLTNLHLRCSPVGWMVGSESDKYNRSLRERRAEWVHHQRRKSLNCQLCFLRSHLFISKPFGVNLLSCTVLLSLLSKYNACTK